MALLRSTRYPGRWTAPSGGHPQGAFKNRTAPGALDGSYIEQDWANDWDGYFSSLLGAAGLTPNGNVDAVGASQYYDALKSIMSTQIGAGQCRLGFVSTTSLRLSPLGGLNVIVNGASVQLPAAGLTVSNSGLAASTLYYVYLSGTTGSLLLELSTTGHSTHTNGVEIKTGDPTRSLVGAVQTNASSQFADAAATRHVASYFNRQTKNLGLFSTTPVNYSNTSSAEISATLRVTFFKWADDAVTITASGQYQVGLSQSISAQAMVDTVAYGNLCADFENSSAAGMSFSSTGRGVLPANTPLTEGFHTVGVFGFVTGSTGTLNNMNLTGDLRI